METLAPEVDRSPQTHNLLDVFAERQASIGAINGTLRQLAGWCPRQAMFGENMSAEDLAKVNDFVVDMANEAGWQDIPEEYQSIFTESLSRRELEPTIGFWSEAQNKSWKLEITPGPTPKAEPTTAKTALSSAKAATLQLPQTANQPSAAKPVEPKPLQRSAVAAEQQPEPAPVRQVNREPVQAIIAQLAKPAANNTINKVKREVPRPTAVESKPQPPTAIEPSKPTIQKPPVKKVLETQLQAAPKTPEIKKRTITKPAVAPKTEAVVPPAPSPDKASPPRDKPVEKSPPAPSLKPIENPADQLPVADMIDLPTVVAPVEDFADMAVEVSEMPKVHLAAKIERLLQPEPESAPEPLAFTLLDRIPETVPATPPFSRQLEQLIVQELTDSEQATALQLLGELQATVTTAVEAQFSPAETRPTDLEIFKLAAELPIPEELRLQVVELLTQLGMPEPTEDIVNRFVVQLRIEALNAQHDQIDLKQQLNILHEQHYDSPLGGVFYLLRSALHRPLGRLALPQAILY